MASTAEIVAVLERRITGLQNLISGRQPTPLIYSVVGEVVVYGCKVTEGESAEDYEIALEGQATGDEERFNPDYSPIPLYPFEQANIASCKAAAFYSDDLTATVELPPATGLARYDIAYIAVGPTGPVFGVISGTPSEDVKADFDLNGLLVTPYDNVTDAALPVGALPVARIYVEDDVEGIPNERIADLRNFDGRLRGAPLLWSDLTTEQKNALINPAAATATAAVLADNAAFKRRMRIRQLLDI